MSRHLITN